MPDACPDPASAAATDTDLAAIPDVGALMADIEREVRERRRAGQIDDEYERELDRLFDAVAPPGAVGPGVDAALVRAERAAIIDPVGPVASRIPGVALLRRVLRKLMAFYVEHIARQVTAFGVTAVRSIRLLGERIDEVEARSPATDPRVLGIEIPVASDLDLESWRELVVKHCAPATGRVLYAECGDGALLVALHDAGIDGYGVDPRPTAASVADERRVEVRTAGALPHLRAVPPGALGGAVLSGCTERLAVGDQVELIDRVAAALAPDAPVVVLSRDPGGDLDPIAADLAPGRPLHAQTWAFLLGRRGFSAIEVHHNDVPASYAVVATRGVVTRVDQVLPRLAARDAVGAHTLAIQGTLRDAGLESDIYAAEWDAEVANRVRHYGDFEDGANGWLLYHASVGSHVAEWFAGREARKLVDYHNVTPHEFFDAWAPEISGLLVSGRHQLEDLAPLAAGGIADSRYNECEMQTAGFEPTAVVPILVEFGRGVGLVDARLQAGLLDTKRGTDWLFVGRLAPNKAQHELIQAFALYRRAFDSEARLWVVGGESSPVYRAALERFVVELDLANAVVLTGSVDDAALGAYYAAADVFVCMSRHEGFCVPVIEAMAHGVPVVARATSAVPETAGDAALLIAEDAPLAEVAAAAHRAATDATVRQALIAAGAARVEHFSVERSQRRLLDAVAGLIGTNA